MSAYGLLVIALWVSVGLAVGALVERWRWIRWAERNHPDEVDTTWL